MKCRKTLSVELGVLHEAEVMDELPDDETKKEGKKDLTSLETKATEKVMAKLPNEANEEQRSKVRSLLLRYRNII